MENTDNPTPRQRGNSKARFYLALLAFCVGWLGILGVLRVQQREPVRSSEIVETAAPVETTDIKPEKAQADALDPPSPSEMTTASAASVQTPPAQNPVDASKQLFKKNIKTIQILAE